MRPLPVKLHLGRRPSRTLSQAIFLAAHLASAQTISLQGTVAEWGVMAMQGFVVSCPQANLVDTTDSQGRWSLVGSTTGLRLETPRPRLLWKDGNLHLELESSRRIRATAFDPGGRLKGRFEGQVAAGPSDIPLVAGISRTSRNFLLVESAGSRWVLPNGTARSLSPDRRESGRASGLGDRLTIVFSANGEVVTVDTLASFVQSGLRRLVQREAAYVYVVSDTAVRIDSVLVNVKGFWGTRRMRAQPNSWTPTRWDYNIFVPYDSTTADDSVRTWAELYGNGGRLTGLSDTLSHRIHNKRINSLADFSASNAFPRARITGPDSVLVDSLTAFSFSTLRADESVARVEWNRVRGPSSPQVGDTARFLWSSLGPDTLVAKLVDRDSNSWVVRRPVLVVNEPSVLVAPADTTISVGDSLTFSVQVWDRVGIDRVVWSWGDGSSDTTRAARVHTAGHRFPGADKISLGSRDSYPLTILAYDTRGGSTYVRSYVEVRNDVPEVFVRDTCGSPSEHLRLRATSRDAGRVVAFRWSDDGISFHDGPADTAIELPATETFDRPLFLQVVDDDGNPSVVDTIHIAVGPNMTDPRDGMRYPLVRIGTQTWFRYNLNHSLDSIPASSSRRRLGPLYTWDQAMGLPDSCRNAVCSLSIAIPFRGICPSGWHIPTQTEWTALRTFAGGTNEAGYHLKANYGWPPKDTAAGTGADTYGFTAQGATDYGGWWSDEEARYWTSTELARNTAVFAGFSYDSRVMRTSMGGKQNGMSIRCIQD